ncbi:MAG: hypothetical protein CME62_04710 [Halobacteriovoraceae bacterium]|nr:hypothetical protein [Halobacteriovoraceae bacterium]|tara:strand:- start:16437 stop:17828 length:1392 start_codon:yes stop_codon:yes gene_type:complete
MAREKLEDKHFDVIIIGGGIVGAGIFRDLCLHKKKTLLLDKNDFNSQTSSGSSKMLHGGIRYLENLDFALVFEALLEKNKWLKLAPHITKEIPFYLPVYQNSKWPLFFMRMGLFLYDLLSLFKNTSHKVFSAQKTQTLLPGINSKGLKGSGLYYDGIVDDHKLGLECVYDGLNHFDQSIAHNYKEVYKVSKTREGKYTVFFQDTLTGKKDLAYTTNIVVATGPFTDQMMHLIDVPWENIIYPSKGSHLWLKKDALPISDALVMQTADKRVVFIIPQREAILVGTTEIPVPAQSDFNDLKPTPQEVSYLLEQVNIYFPEAKVSFDHIMSSFAAVRPLVKDGHSSSKISRNHKIYNPQKKMWVIAGGKYTTFRKMAEDLNKKLFAKNDWSYDKKKSSLPFSQVSVIAHPFRQKIQPQDIDDILQKELVRTQEDLVLRRLSLQTLDHLNDPVIIDYIEKLPLQTIR